MRSSWSAARGLAQYMSLVAKAALIQGWFRSALEVEMRTVWPEEVLRRQERGDVREAVGMGLGAGMIGGLGLMEWSCGCL